MFQFKDRQTNHIIPSLAFLVYSGLQYIGQDLPTLGKAICFTQSTKCNVNLIQKHPYRHTHKI